VEQIIRVARVQELVSTVGPAMLLTRQTASTIIAARTRLLQEAKLDLTLAKELMALSPIGPGLFNGRLAEVVKTYSDRAAATSALLGDQVLIAGPGTQGFQFLSPGHQNTGTDASSNWLPPS
jgi:hypothetical protein